MSKPEERNENARKDPQLLWDCFVNWSLTLEKIEKDESIEKS
jgi:hypothetical protein